MQGEIELENPDANDYEGDAEISSPFSTKDIKVTNQIVSLDSLVDMLAHGDIDLNPDFQRNPDLWDKMKMSRLIESILLSLRDRR